jgi:putative transposase
MVGLGLIEAVGMARQKHTAEHIISKLRAIEVGLSAGRSVAEICRAVAVTEQTYYRWRAEYGGLKLDQAKRLKDLERENARLRKAVADLALDKLILKETAAGNF